MIVAMFLQGKDAWWLKPPKVWNGILAGVPYPTHPVTSHRIPKIPEILKEGYASLGHGSHTHCFSLLPAAAERAGRDDGGEAGGADGLRQGAGAAQPDAGQLGHVLRAAAQDGGLREHRRRQASRDQSRTFPSDVGHFSSLEKQRHLRLVCSHTQGFSLFFSTLSQLRHSDEVAPSDAQHCNNSCPVLVLWIVPLRMQIARQCFPSL